MAEIRCPMCGKPNPDHLDVCQFCEARLKPLTASLPSDDVPPDDSTPGQPEPSSDLPDWLNFDTDSQLEEDDEAGFSDAAPFDDGDDWLSRLENDPESKESPPLQPGAEPDVEQHTAARMDFNNNGIPDWMEDIERTRSTSALEQSEETVEGEFPTWLSADEGSDKSSKLPDWMIDSGSTSKDADPLPEAENDLPDWLAASDDQPANLSEEGNEHITQPDWKSDHHAAEAGTELPAADDDKTFFSPGYVGQETVPNQDMQGNMDLPDWLNDSKTTVGEGDSLEEVESVLPASEGDLPDWLSDLGGEEAASPEEAIPAQASTPAFTMDDAGDLPDWLTSEDDGATESELPAAEGDLPDWLSDLGGEEAETTEEPIPAQASTPAFDLDDAGDLPDWLTDEDDGTDESVLPAAEGDLPDWLSDLSSDETAEPEEAILKQASTQAFIADDSEELSDLPSAEQNGEAESPLPVDDNGLPTWLTNGDAEEDDELPDWFSDLGGEEISKIQETISSEEIPVYEEVPPTRVTSVPSFSKDDVEERSDWFENDDFSDGNDEEAAPISQAEEGDLPNWLSDLIDEETAVSEEAVPTQASVPAFTADDEEDLPDWLSGEDNGDVTPVPKAEEGDLPDWLSDLGGEEISEPEEAVLAQASVPAFTADDEEDLPDWLSSEDEQETESTFPATESDLPDWISELSAEQTTGDQEGSERIVEPQEAPTSQETTPAFTPDELKTGVTDWLTGGDVDEVETVLTPAESNLPDLLSGEDEVEIESTLPAEESDLPDWLSDLVGEEAVSDREGSEKTAEPDDQDAVPAFLPDASRTGVTDWLSDGSADEVKTVLSPAESDLPDWISGEDKGEAESTLPAEESDLPTWISDLGGEEISEPEEAISMAISADEAEELPEWLRGEDEVEAESDLPAEESDLPTWISDLGGEEISEPEEAISMAIPADEAEELPEWLRGEDGGEAESDLPTEESDLPDWLSDFDDEKITGIDDVAKAAIPTIAAIDDLPEWLPEVDGIEVEPTKEILSGSEPDLQPTNFDESRAVPDWLGDIDGGPVSGALDDASFGDDGEAEPADAVSYELEDGFEDDLSGFDHLPEWLSDSSQTDSDQVQEITGPVDDIAPADLPDWLAAMRPVESATPKALEVDRSGPVESSGPLAGLYSVLAAEPEIAQLKKPPVYSNKLQVSDSQQTHATLLGDMLQAEGKSQALPLPPMISSHRVFRLILGIMLLAIAFIAVFVGGEMVAMPAPEVIPAGVEQTFQIIAAISQEDTVLISFDFEPGLIGEMDATSAAVVDHIMQKGAKLALVSTSPTGPALAERFINNVQENHQYSSGTQYVNLGYIPGGVSGLAAFAQNPNWVAPTTLDGYQAWETQPLINIKSVSDFAMVLLITDNPNTTRAWVEQVNPYLEPVPLVAVVSAQVEPVARTYFGQIDGLVSGMTGGAAYEVMSGGNLAREQWDAFNITLIIAVSAILIGGIISIGSTVIARQKENGGESA